MKNSYVRLVSPDGPFAEGDSVQDVIAEGTEVAIIQCFEDGASINLVGVNVDIYITDGPLLENANHR